MHIVLRHLFELFQPAICPGDGLVKSILQRYLVVPAELAADLAAIQSVCCIFAKALTDDLDGFFEAHAHSVANHLDQLPHADHPVRRDMERFTWLGVSSDPQ